ncbi:hypothetical protein GCM10010228_75190 [Streptomyces massasporeus]|nr:hypothetical protein GCM10010228_75190 [Streptomyces massasporeus]
MRAGLLAVDALPAKGGENGETQGQRRGERDTAAREGRRDGDSLPAGKAEGYQCGNRGEQNGHRQDEKQERCGAVVHECTALTRFHREGIATIPSKTRW